MVVHSLVVQFWENKDKCSSRARSDKAKAFKLPLDIPGYNHMFLFCLCGILTGYMSFYYFVTTVYFLC